MIGYRFNPPEAGKGLIPRCLRRQQALQHQSDIRQIPWSMLLAGTIFLITLV